MPAEASTKAGPKDVFLHLLAIIMLYVSVGSFIALIFQYINVLLPDPALEGNYYSLQAIYSSMRWSIALLVVVYPVFVWTSWFLNKDYTVEPLKREIRIRKWLLYFTLFAAALLMIGDVISLIYNFLQGELTVRILFKILTILLIAGTVFKYYLMDLKNNAPHKIFLYGVSVVIAVAIIAGFVIAGSPKSARLIQIDNIRIQNLQELQSQIVQYWQYKGSLPANLEALRSIDVGGYVAPTDPESHAPYEYNVKGPLDFSLCATFALASLAEGRTPAYSKPYAPYPAGVGGLSQNWDHAEGHVCFDRRIDKDFYKLPAEKI